MIITSEFLLCLIFTILTTIVIIPFFVLKHYVEKKDKEYVFRYKIINSIKLCKMLLCMLFFVNVSLLLYPLRFTKNVAVDESKTNFVEYYNYFFSKNISIIKSKNINSERLKSYIELQFSNKIESKLVLFQERYVVEHDGHQISLVFSNEEEEYIQLSITGFSNENELHNSIPVEFLCDLLNPILSFELESNDFDYLLSEDCYIGDIELEQTAMKDILYISDYGLGDQVYMMVTREKNDELALYITGLTKASMFF